jgi:uncharacterized membrane protein
MELTGKTLSRSELRGPQRDPSPRTLPTLDLGSESTLRWLAGLLSVLGLLVAGYLSLESLLGEPGCSVEGCGKVLNSEFSKVELPGVKVTVGIHWFGVIGYLMILIASLLRGDKARIAAFGLSTFGFGTSVFLFILQATEIGAFCPYCLTSGALMTLLFITNSARAFRFLGAGNQSSETEVVSENTKAGDDQEVVE